VSFVTALLGEPARVAGVCHDPNQQRALVAQALTWIALGGMVFGAVVGSERGGGQIAVAAAKIPIATLLALAVSGPAVWAVAKSFGRDWTFPTAIALLLSAGARSALVLLACAAPLWVAIDLGVGYTLARLAAAAAYGLGCISGTAFLARALGPAPGRVPALLVGGALFAAVAAQSAWILRPYIGDPRDESVPLMAQGRIEGGVLGVLRRDLGGR
jgi:hypothetical protein